MEGMLKNMWCVCVHDDVIGCYSILMKDISLLNLLPCQQMIMPRHRFMCAMRGFNL